MKRFFEEHISSLSKCEIFVFGSNFEGRHSGGAPSLAHQKFGAEWGIGVGRTGQCYAIPTMHGGLNEIKSFVNEFIDYARAHPNNRFLVARVGCGSAGFTDEEMAPLFKNAHKLPNVNFSIEWLLELDNDDFIDAVCFGIVPDEPVISLPDALTETDLIELCETYKYVIGSGVKVTLPEIRIRYVINSGQFGYAKFGDFFMLGNGELYVWTQNERFKNFHNQTMVEDIFGDECFERKKYFIRAIFAGVETEVTDFNGRHLYTGDVIRVWLKGYDNSSPLKYSENNSMLLAFGTLGENDDEFKARYACVLDNQSVFPDMCAKIEWSGTVFYQLDWNEQPITIGRRCLDFMDHYGQSGLSAEDKEVLARYTPNFDQELWKYHANKSLGIEFNSK